MKSERSHFMLALVLFTAFVSLTIAEDQLETEATVTETKATATEIETTVTKNQTPVIKTQTPVTETQEPVTETQEPVTKTQEPVTETQSPVTKKYRRCGRDLVEMIEFFCSLAWNSKSEIDNETNRRNRRASKRSTGKIGFGPVHYCCRHGCTYEEVMRYCHNFYS